MGHRARRIQYDTIVIICGVVVRLVVADASPSLLILVASVLLIVFIDYIVVVVSVGLVYDIILCASCACLVRLCASCVSSLCAESFSGLKSACPRAFASQPSWIERGPR